MIQAFTLILIIWLSNNKNNDNMIKKKKKNQYLIIQYLIFKFSFIFYKNKNIKGHF